MKHIFRTLIGLHLILSILAFSNNISNTVSNLILGLISFEVAVYQFAQYNFIKDKEENCCE